MGYVVLHIEKAAGTDAAMSGHVERRITPANVITTLTYLNEELVEFPKGVTNRTEAIQHRLDNAGLERKIGKNQVRALRVMLSGSPEDMKRIRQAGQLDAWAKDSCGWLQKTFGKENVVSAVLHLDEKTPHIHATVVPITRGERRKAKLEREKNAQSGKRTYRTKKDRPRLCADDVMARDKLKAYQTTYAEAMAKYGLQRGIDGSKARHKSTQQYYNETKKLTDSLKTEVVDLQRQKETAQEELKRAKKEIQTEKLKGAATTAAANIAESVGSLFGSNKVKILERRNEDLQDRILELEEEARHREQQQAKHIQEITDAYEQRHRKLSEFVDYVKHYFPYVEKLMPTIKFLRDTLNFGDALIRKLCTFKDVSIKGELYSCEFNQHFKADKTICSLKEDKEGNFNLHIDGVSHVSWFRRKKEEFIEKLRPQARRQNRGINL